MEGDGDLRGRVHVGSLKQDLLKLQTRKMKGLKAGLDEMEGVDEEGREPNGFEDSAKLRKKRKQI